MHTGHSMSAAGKHASPKADTTRFTRLQIGVAVLGVLIIAAFGGSTAYDAYRSYRHAVVAIDREINNVANALAEQTAWSLQSVDLLLLDTARWYHSDSQSIPPGHIGAVLEARTPKMRIVRQVMIIDAQGNQRYGSLGSAPPTHNVADRSYFIAQRDGVAKGLFISEPLVTRSEGRDAIDLSRRLDDDAEGFTGIVIAVVDLDDLTQLYRAVNLGMNSAIQLVRDDGTLLARNPPTTGAVGQKFSALTAAPADRIVSPLDGKPSFIAVAHVRDTPLMLVVTRDEAVALRPWRDETIRVGVRTLVLTLLGAIIVAALLRQIRRVEVGEQALRKSEQRYALAMEGANEGHWDWDLATRSLFLSPKMKILYGLSADDRIETRDEWRAKIVIHPDDVARFEAALADHLEGRTARYECEYRVRQPNGDWHWLAARGRLVRDPSGGSLRLVGSSSDVTAQRQAQADKEQLEAQLRQSQKMEAIGTLAGGIAHDFNNILGAILGYGELAQQQSAAGSPLRRYLDNVMHAAERAKTLVERILGFSRSGLGDRVPVNIQSVVEETLELLAASLPVGIRLESRVESGNAAVIGDPTDLHQVAMNLCTNAVQAMAGGGVLQVILESVELVVRRTLSRGSLAAGSYVRLSVSDTGSGIPLAVLERIFDPFFTTKAVGAGTGLGLSLVHGIVADLGGAIDVSSKAGEGTRFEIWLPVAGETEVPAVAAAGTLPRGNGETVMIVDDERPLLALAEEIIAELGYEPVGFDSSAAALAAFRDRPQRFDAILTDESMPELIGTALAHEIRQIRAAIPIILMSGYGGAQLTTRAAELGINEVLRKPLHRRDLAESLARVLRTQH
ncbi:MAG: ATP-binding protein [Steroidobacteraceae bacterium]|jgi:PAS domain S-box-containing protein